MAVIVIWFKRATASLFVCLSSFMLLAALRSSNLNIEEISPKAFLIFALLLVMIFIIAITPLRAVALRGFFALKAFFKKRIRICSGVVIIAAVAYQVFLIVFLRHDPGFDPAGLFYLEQVAYRGETPPNTWYYDYLSNYPNNHFFFFLMHAFSWITDGPRLAVWLLINAFCIDIGVLMTALAAKKKYGKKFGYITLYLGLLMVVFQPYVLVPYTDTMVFPLVAAGLLLVAHYAPTWSMAKHVGMGMLLGLTAALTYLMKPSSIMLYIALAILCLLWIFSAFIMRKKSASLKLSDEPAGDAIESERVLGKSLKKILVYVLSGLLVLILSVVGFQKFVDTQTYVAIDRSKSFPLIHFVMMGMPKLIDGVPDYTGGWYYDDVVGTWYAGGHEEKIAYSLSQIKERFEYFGISGYVAFLPQKFSANTSDGAFGYAGDGTAYVLSDLGSNIGTQTVGNLYFTDGKLWNFFLFCNQLIWISCLILVIFSYRKADFYSTALKLAITGGLLFLLLFEGGRSRYLIQYLPYFLILASTGFVQLSRWCKARCSKDKGIL